MNHKTPRNLSFQLVCHSGVTHKGLSRNKCYSFEEGEPFQKTLEQLFPPSKNVYDEPGFDQTTEITINLNALDAL